MNRSRGAKLWLRIWEVTAAVVTLSIFVFLIFDSQRDVKRVKEEAADARYQDFLSVCSENGDLYKEILAEELWIRHSYKSLFDRTHHVSTSQTRLRSRMTIRSHLSFTQFNKLLIDELRAAADTSHRLQIVHELEVYLEHQGLLPEGRKKGISRTAGGTVAVCHWSACPPVWTWANDNLMR